MSISKLFDEKTIIESQDKKDAEKRISNQEYPEFYGAMNEKMLLQTLNAREYEIVKLLDTIKGWVTFLGILALIGLILGGCNAVLSIF